MPHPFPPRRSSDLGVITIDDDAAGAGWFVDPSPGDAAEFTGGDADHLLDAAAGSAAAGRIDLLTALMHEIGHLFDLPHVPAISGKQLMSDRLGASERRLVTEIAVSAATGPGAQEDEGGAPGPGPITTVQLPAAGKIGRAHV